MTDNQKDKIQIKQTNPKSNKRNNAFAKKYFFLLMGLTIVFWAFAFPFIRIGLDELTPVNLTIMRLFIVCIIFLFLMIVKPNKFSKPQKKDIIPLFLLGFLGIVMYHLCKICTRNPPPHNNPGRRFLCVFWLDEGAGGAYSR